MRVLITRFDSRVGAELSRRLAPFVDVLSPGRGELDLEDPRSIARAVRTADPDLLINTASCAQPIEPDPDAALAVYAHAPRFLAEEAARCGCPIIHFSTDRIFDGRQPDPYRENDRAAPSDVQGRAQLLGERALAAAKVPYLVLRVAWVYGRRDLEARAGWGMPFGEEAPWRGSPTWSGHVAGATLAMLDSLAAGEPLTADRLYVGLHARGGFYHVSAGGATTPAGFAAAIEARSNGTGRGGDVSRTGIPSPETLRNRMLDTSRISREYGIDLGDWAVGLDACLSDVAASSAAAPVASG